MNTNRVRFALQEAEEDICVFIQKILDANTFCHSDICWWWNPDVFWLTNSDQAEKLIRLLVAENCCVRVNISNYKKNLEFEMLLKSMLHIEEILKERKGGDEAV